MENCKICNNESKPCFEADILKKYKTTYYKCISCGFIQTDQPFWLDEAYTSAITKQDVGLLKRNLLITPILATLINTFFRRGKEFIDYGGGYGILTRLMRDKGYNFNQFDIYCDNIFSVGFDKIAPGETANYELLTSFEVFEHLLDPVNELSNMLKWSSNIFFSTELQPSKVDSPTDWWYIMPETGQHIAFYTEKSLQLMGAKFGLLYYTNGFNLHLFTKMKINSYLLGLIMNYKIAKLFDLANRNKKTLTMDDYYLSKES